MGITPRPASQRFSILRRRTHHPYHHDDHDYDYHDYDYHSHYDDYDYCFVAADDCFYDYDDYDYDDDCGGGFAGVRGGGGRVRWLPRAVCGRPASACCAQSSGGGL